MKNKSCFLLIILFTYGSGCSAIDCSETNPQTCESLYYSDSSGKPSPVWQTCRRAADMWSNSCALSEADKQTVISRCNNNTEMACCAMQLC